MVMLTGEQHTHRSLRVNWPERLHQGYLTYAVGEKLLHDNALITIVLVKSSCLSSPLPRIGLETRLTWGMGGRGGGSGCLMLNSHIRI